VSRAPAGAILGRMAPPARKTRAAWIEAGLQALATGGPDAVRIEPLAQRLGVTRGSFYGYFKSRQAFLDALLDTWEQRSTDEVLERVARDGGDARARIRLAGILTFREELLPIDLAVRDWARRDDAVARRLRRVDGRRMDYLRAQIGTLCPDPDEVEARTLLAFTLAIGDHFLSAPAGTREHAAVLERALEHILR
jgi:AcrR family transcriptional regulator